MNTLRSVSVRKPPSVDFNSNANNPAKLRLWNFVTASPFSMFALLTDHSIRFRMSTDNLEKPVYFANTDFEKTVADIIASPRRCKLQTRLFNNFLNFVFVRYFSEKTLYDITERQKDYYMKCFRHLLKSSQVFSY